MRLLSFRNAQRCAALGLFVSIGACVVDASDDDGGAGGSDDDDDEEVCTVDNVSDVSDCDEDCDAAVEGEDGMSQCTVSCSLSSSSCPSSGQVCVELTDGTGACLSDCDADADCPSDEHCDTSLDVCLPGTASTDGSCTPSNVVDIDGCDADCDAAIEGATGVYECTVTCSPSAQDCALVGQYCVELEDGTGACLDDCIDSMICPDASDTCDPELFVCLPQTAP